MVSSPAHVMITTSLLSRGLNFSPSIKHVFIAKAQGIRLISCIEQVGLGELGRAGKLLCLGRVGEEDELFTTTSKPFTGISTLLNE
jgi:hypothetical protein